MISNVDPEVHGSKVYAESLFLFTEIRKKETGIVSPNFQKTILLTGAFSYVNFRDGLIDVDEFQRSWDIFFVETVLTFSLLKSKRVDYFLHFIYPSAQNY